MNFDFGRNSPFHFHLLLCFRFVSELEFGSILTFIVSFNLVSYLESEF